MKNNVFTIFPIQGGETGKNVSNMFLKIFSEKLKKKTVYIPVGITFDDGGAVSMTQLYYNFVRNRELKFQETKLTVIRPFNCFAEMIEICDENFCKFIEKIADGFEISIVNLERASANAIKYFLEESMTIALVIDCEQDSYLLRTESFIRNMRLLGENNLAEFLNKTIFVISNGKEKQRDLLLRVVREEGKSRDYDFSNKFYFYEKGTGFVKSLMRRAEDFLNAQ